MLNLKMLVYCERVTKCLQCQLILVLLRLTQSILLPEKTVQIKYLLKIPINAQRLL